MHSENHTSETLLHAADVSAVTQLVLLERESRDLGRWERMRACFHPDSKVRLSWYTGDGAGFVAGSIDMAARGMLAKHRLGPVLVRLGVDRAVASFSGVIDIPAMLDGVEVQLSSHARFLYGAERRERQWKIHSFDAIYLRDELAPAVPGESIHVAPGKLAGFRRPYRMLSYLLSLQGYAVDMELAGDDRPELCRALERELFDWAGVEA